MGGKGGEREGKRKWEEGREKGRKGEGKDPHCFLDKSNPAHSASVVTPSETTFNYG